MAATGFIGGDPNKVNDSGDTMTGPLVLPGDPVAPLQAADKAYVDAKTTDWVNVKAYGAKGDGTTNDIVAIQIAATAAVGGTLYFPEGTYLIDDTVQIGDQTAIRFDGRGSVLKYTGDASAIQCTTFKGLLIEGGGTIDLSAAGTDAVGLHIAGVWFATINDLKVIQGPANSTGILVETGAPGSPDYFGSFCVTINNPDLWGTAGAYGIRCKKTDADPNPINSVTHFQVNNGWCSGKNYGLHLAQTSTVHIDGYCVDNAIDAYYVEKSSCVVLQPGELGPVSGWCINFGDLAQDIYLLTPSYVGSIGETQQGYVNTGTVSGPPVQFSRGTMALRAATGATPESIPYYVNVNSRYDYSKAMNMVVRGGGGETELMAWDDANGLVLNGGAGIRFANDLIVWSADGNQRRVRAFNGDQSQKVDIYHDGNWAQYVSTTGHVFESDGAGKGTVAIGASTPQLKAQYNGGSFGAISLGHDDTEGTLASEKGDLNLTAASGQTNVDGNLSVANVLAAGLAVKLPNVSSPPGAQAGAGLLYVENGALKYVGPNGTVTTIAPA